GGVAKEDLKAENVEAVRKGAENLKRHIENVRKFGIQPVVAINRFITDTDAEMKAVMEIAESAGTRAFACTHWADGGKGTEDLARHVVEICESGKADCKTRNSAVVRLRAKTKTLPRSLYGVEDIRADATVRNQLTHFEAHAYGHLPICIATTQHSFSTNPNLRGAP